MRRYQSFEQAYQHGVDAARAGRPLSACEYQVPHQRAAFKYGWHDEERAQSVKRVLTQSTAPACPKCKPEMGLSCAAHAVNHPVVEELRGTPGAKHYDSHEQAVAANVQPGDPNEVMAMARVYGAKRKGEMTISKADNQLCTLRELMLARAAYMRSFHEFEKSISRPGNAFDSNERGDIGAAVDLLYDRLDDPRDVGSEWLASLLRTIRQTVDGI